MAVPKKKTSQSRKRRRHGMRQRLTIKKLQDRLNITKSKDSWEFSLGHHVCLKSGKYNGKQVLTIKTKDSSTVVDA
jgi:large subunit ribosomal protein L32